MTPEEAHRLLEGTTPGPWFFDDDMDGTVHTIGPIVPCGNELECSTDDAALAAHAPDMASMIAGMREEWGVSCGGEKPGAWWASREEADQCAKRMSICIHYPLPIVVVRRYVTTEEGIS